MGHMSKRVLVAITLRPQKPVVRVFFEVDYGAFDRGLAAISTSSIDYLRPSITWDLGASGPKPPFVSAQDSLS